MSGPVWIITTRDVFLAALVVGFALVALVAGLWEAWDRLKAWWAKIWSRP